jgi:GT2 family glycosyltransferase
LFDLKETAVVILNFNGKDFLEKFLPNVIENTSQNCEVIVADNASTDESISFLKQNHPTIRLILLDQNTGYAGGYNNALQHLQHKYFILLNSDVEVTKNWDTPLIAKLQSDEVIVACQPKILSYHQKTHFEYAGASGGYIDKDYIPFCRGRLLGKLEEDKKQYDTATEVAWATGAALAIKSDAYKLAKGLDEDFFAHMEEIDLCLRLKNMGKAIWVEPSSIVYHVGGGTLSAQSPFKLYLNFRNNLFLIYKNHYSSSLFWKITRRLCIDGLAGVSYLVKFQFSFFLAVLKAHFHFYKDLSNLKQKRAVIAKTLVKIPNKKGFTSESLLKVWYIKQLKTFSAFNESKFF